MTGSRSFEGLLDSETSGMADSCFSAFAVVGIQRFVRPCASQLLFSHWPKSIWAFHFELQPDLTQTGGLHLGLFNSQFHVAQRSGLTHPDAIELFAEVEGYILRGDASHLFDVV
jgi:hypothetical protein